MSRCYVHGVMVGRSCTRDFTVTIRRSRYLESGEVLLERDSIAPLNLARKVDGRVVVFPSTSPN